VSGAAGGDGPRPLRGSLERVVASLGGPSVHGVTSLFERWDEIVGASLAAHARPHGIEDGVLVVVVDEPGWATQLRFLAATLRERAADVLGPGVVREVQVRLAGPWRGGGSRGTRRPGW
jgi:predicted nucleic acid-binding Zn ribbon protein